jgi:ATP-dependent exoDNAse (exonuclease V) beta subunit
VDRPPEYFREGEFSVRPGEHHPQCGTHSVVWWDPSALHLGVEPSHGLRQGEILADKPAANVNEGVEAYRNWRIARQDLLQHGERPLYEIFTPSEATQPPEGFLIPVEIETLPRAQRPSGPRFGTLVHGILRDVPLDADHAAIAAMAEVHARLLSAPPEEVEAAVDAVAAVLTHPLLDRARRSPRMHREYPILFPHAGRLLEGVIDLAFLEEGAWTIVDFKTDADVPARAAHYRTQLLWYAFALARTTSMAARAILLSA